MLLGDSSQVQQVVLNLLMNAAEATQGRAGATVNVETSANGSDAMVVLEVSDNGEGITPENLAKIFDPFFTTKPEGKGVGLGLAVVYGIVQEHGGEIDGGEQGRRRRDLHSGAAGGAGRGAGRRRYRHRGQEGVRFLSVAMVGPDRSSAVRRSCAGAGRCARPGGSHRSCAEPAARRLGAIARPVQCSHIF